LSDPYVDLYPSNAIVINDEDDYVYGELRCKLCGKPELHWEEIDSHKWVLVSRRHLVHRCAKLNAKNVDDFMNEVV